MILSIQGFMRRFHQSFFLSVGHMGGRLERSGRTPHRGAPNRASGKPRAAFYAFHRDCVEESWAPKTNLNLMIAVLSQPGLRSTESNSVWSIANAIILNCLLAGLCF